MTTNAKIGYGNLFQLFQAAPANDFVTVAEVTSITMPPQQRDAIEATHTESPEGWREFIPGLKNAGEVKLEMNFVAASDSDSLIRSTFDSDDLTRARILFRSPDSPTEAITMDVIVTNYEVSGPIADKMVASVTLKISGKPVWGH
jgi:predicted secreted protein